MKSVTTSTPTEYVAKRYSPGFVSAYPNEPEIFTFKTKKELLGLHWIASLLYGGDSRLVFSQDAHFDDSGRLLIETVSTKERYVLALPMNAATSRVFKRWFPSRDEERRRKNRRMLKAYISKTESMKFDTCTFQKRFRAYFVSRESGKCALVPMDIYGNTLQGVLNKLKGTGIHPRDIKILEEYAPLIPKGHIEDDQFKRLFQ